jgi:hypothetical protein
MAHSPGCKSLRTARAFSQQATSLLTLAESVSAYGLK